ncbi:hypothetical protein IFO69_18260 [Echinicola sp. CAU 1574]|uniref:DUF3325 domain-containing protein n=1 Tax=Echinicola arenosa TaxID=2774144 RepID=A0ABR9APJ2_9BACT|nr:hypothetical protein [Echinicola arenosa]MBD8490702.1 hypothetical protein [Echinicola arenosa]
MITLAALLTFLGFFCFYNTSKRLKLSQSLGLEVWLQQNANKAKWIGGILLIVALLICLVAAGFAAGIFSFFILLMTAGSLIVILSPLKFINYKVLSVVFVLSLIFELI